MQRVSWIADVFELGMRPVGAPEQAVDAEGWQQFGPGARARGEGRFGVSGFRAHPIPRGYLDPHAPRLAQRDQVFEAGVAGAERGIEPPEMIERMRWLAEKFTRAAGA